MGKSMAVMAVNSVIRVRKKHLSAGSGFAQLLDHFGGQALYISLYVVRFWTSHPNTRKSTVSLSFPELVSGKTLQETPVVG